jgi:hypothetical protein
VAEGETAGGVSSLNPEPLELLVQIGPDHGQGHVVMVRSSTGATATGTFHSPITPDRLSELAALLEDGARPASYDDFDSPLSLRLEESEAERIGGDLFRRLFSDSIRTLWDSSLAIAADRHSHLKLRLEFDLRQEKVVPLVALPWELLFDADRRDFLVLSRESPLLRSLSVLRPLHPPTIPRPLRILAILGDSWGTVDLDLQREIRSLENRLKEHRGVEMAIVRPGSHQELTAAIRSREFHVLHYMGHGHFDQETGEGLLFLRGESGRQVTVNGDDLAAALKDVACRLVILNACETARTAISAAGHPFAGLAAALVLAGVPSVIAMQVPIRNSASFALTEAFYRHLLRGDPLEIALTEGRLAVRANYPRMLDWAIPVLYSRSADSRLFPSASLSPEIQAGIIDASRYIQEKAGDFHGREWLFDKIDRFVNEHPCGHFILRGDPGIGKSSVLARLVQRDSCVHHFNIRSEGIQRPEQFLENVCSQLIAAHALDHASLPPEATRSASFLNKLLAQVSAGLRDGEKVIIVVDALDESDTTLLAPGVNPLYLPSSLPAGIYFVLSSRRDETVPRFDGEQARFDLIHDSIDNEGDIRTFVASWLHRPGVQVFLTDRGSEAPGFMEEIAEKSQGNFMYLRHALREIESGTWGNLPLGEIPCGLESYYESHWRQLRQRDEQSWLTDHLPVLVALTVVREPVSAELIASFSGVSDHRRISSVLRAWSPFLHVTESQRYRLYHDSFQRFIADKDEVSGERVHLSDAHERMMGTFDEIWRDLTFSEDARKEKEGLASRQEILDYSFRHAIGHFYSRGKYGELLVFIERESYLARQVEHFRGFRQTSEDLESFVLRAAVEEEDWSRFLRYAAVALNLRGLAEDLAEWTILRALVQDGQLELATDLARSVSDPLQRVVAQAAIVSACDPASARRMLSELRQGWEEPLAQTSDATELRRRSDLLARMARQLGPELADRWSAWIEHAGLPPELADATWRAVAESWLDRGDALDQGIWTFLRKVAPKTLLQFLPQRLALLAPDQPGRIREELRELLGAETDAAQLAWMSFLGHLSRKHPKIAIPAWESWIVDEEVSWSPALLEAGHPLWANLTPVRLETFAAGLRDPLTIAALWVCLLEEKSDHAVAERALNALERVSDGSEKLHWALRNLDARPDDPRREVRSQLAGVGRYLDAMRYEAAPADLRRYLDLVSSYFPDELTSQMDNMIWSQGGTPVFLRELARSSTSDEVLSHLEARAADYAAAVAPNQAEGFLLRAEVRIDAACRLCVKCENLKSLDQAKERLLPSEEDDLRCALAPLLKTPDLAHIVCEGIVDRRRALITRLSTIGLEELPPAVLYETIVRIGALEEEISGLALLCEDPRDFRGLMERAFETIPDSDERAAVLLRLAWHALSAQAGSGPRWDPEAVFEPIREGLIFENRERLAVLTPDIAALAAQTGGRRAEAEVLAAIERLSNLRAVALPVRRQAIGRLLGLLPTVFLPLVKPNPAQADRQSAKVLSRISRLPDRIEPETAEPGLPRSPSDAGAEPMLRRLWEISSANSRQKLAWEVIHALRSDGRPGAEAALRCWLHVHIAPRLGEANAAGRGRAQEAVAALSSSKAL